MPTAPNAPMFRTDNFSGPGNQPITAGQAAAIAVARLQLPTIAPGIGPSPDLNPWNMAAVGYPLVAVGRWRLACWVQSRIPLQAYPCLWMQK